MTRRRDPRQTTREKLLFRYSSALERGDFTTVAAVLHEAERDPALEQMILELNAAYEVESVKPVPHFSQNGHREETAMINTTYVTPKTRERTPTFSLSATVAAAAAALILFGAMFFANRPALPDNGAPSGLLQVTETATPFPPTEVPPAGAAAALLPRVGSDELALVCQGKTPDMILEVRTQPGGGGVVVGYLPAHAAIDIVDSASDRAGQVYFYAIYEVGGQRVQGWLASSALAQTERCPVAETGELMPTVVPPEATVTVEYVVQPGDTFMSIITRFGFGAEDVPMLLAMNNLSSEGDIQVGDRLLLPADSAAPGDAFITPVVATATATPVPLNIDPIAMTATHIIIEATQTAEGLLATAAP